MPSPEQRRSILITGSSSGVGKALALHFVSAGWLVFATVRKASDAQALRKDAAQAGAAKPGSVSPGVLQPVLMDVTDEASVQKAMQEVEATCGERGLNVLVNNAGLAVFGPLETTSIQAWEKVFQTNVFGVATATRYFLPLLRRAAKHQSKGSYARIINIGSAAGKVSAPLQTVYTASKHALEGLTDCLRAELAPQHIDVVLMQLGAVATAMAGKIRAESLATSIPQAYTQTDPTTSQSTASTASTSSAPTPSPAALPSKVTHTGEANVDSVYAAQVKETLEVFECMESISIPMQVVVRAMNTAATVSKPKTRYAVDGQIATAIWLRWAMTDRMWDWFYPIASNMTKAKAKKAQSASK